jgi:WD40 repeat protein
VRSVAFSPPDKKIIASSSEDNTVWLSDASSGAQVREPLEGHDDYVRSVAFIPDGKSIA